MPDVKTIRAKLLEKYGENIVISSTNKKTTTVCFRGTSKNILTKHWYENRKVNKEEERQRIVEAAAIIIREDIRSQINDTSSYPAPNDFLTNVDSVIPKTLSLFLNSVILSNKNGDGTHVSKKCTSIAHATMSATRPRSFRSTIQMSVGIYLHRKFESRYLINILSSLGLCSTYHDIIKFETSSFIYPPTRVLENSFSQFVFDNADFNSCTIDGLHTTHIMGGICCATPALSVIPDEPLIIVKTLPSAKDISKYGQVPIYYYEKGIESGLENIEIRDLNQFTTFQRTTQHLQPIDVLWACGKYLKINNLSGWNGYMENICQLSPIDFTFANNIFTFCRFTRS